MEEGYIFSLYELENDNYEVLKWMILDICLGEYDAVKKVGYCAAYPLEEAGDITTSSVSTLKTDFDEMFNL